MVLKVCARPPAGIKVILVMKLMIIFLFAACFAASAKVSSQITLSEKNSPLQKIFKSIEKQSGYDFIYTYDVIEQAGTVTVSVRNVSLEQALQEALKGKDLTYQIINKTVVVKSKQSSTINAQLPQPPITVRGRIVNEDGEPVIASVLVKGTNNGLTTNADGYFELKNVDENAILVISGVSIEQDVEVKVNGRNDIGNIATVTKTVEGTDVVVKTNYWETTQRKNTGNITKITSKDLGKQPVTSLLMALQGRVPGLDIVPNSGVPGTATQIFLRGQNSVRFDGSLPLYVIDGVPIDPRPLFSASNFFDTGIDPFVSLTPDNIASIEVLKDADATAIYGSRGANGVIIITTKKGMRGSQTSVDVGFYKGGGVVPHKIDLLNAKQFLAMRREALANTPRQPNTFDYDLNGVWDTTRSTDWQDVLLGETADITDLRVNFSGSSNTITYKLGGGYHSEGLVYPGDFGFKSMTGYYSMSHHSVNQKFRSSLSVNYGYNKTKTFNNDNIVTLALTLSPVAPSLYDANGELNWQKTPGGASSWTNPLAGSRKTDEVSNSSFLVSSDISYQLLKGLDIKMNTGYTEVNGQQVTKDPLSSRDPNSSSFPNATGESSFGINKRSSWIIEPQLSYRKIFKGHAIEALIGTTFQQSVTQYRRTLGQGYISDELLGSLNGAATTTITEDIDSKYRYAALFARIGYTWKGRYLVNLTGRRDGSSRFAPGKQFGDFGAIGLGWIFTEEAWINKQIPWMSFGKIRFSMGLAGNDQIGDYQFYDTYTPGITPYQGGVTLNPTRLYNPDYAWETTRKIEAAIELGFFEDRVSVGVSWYRHRSDNQLVSVPLPSITGFVAVTDNFDALVENTGWEFAMSATYIQQKNWRWTGSVNFSIPRNKLVRFDNIGQSNFATTFKVGEPLTIRKYYIYTGIDQTTGLHTVKDVDGNGIINSTDQQFGQPFYRRFGGMNNTIGYKNFELSFLIQYVNQNRVRADLFANAPGPTVLNHPVFVLNRWTKPGDVTDVQRFTAATAAVTAYGRYAISDKAVTDASFVRLKTLSLSWSLPATFIKKAKIQQAKLFIQGQNLFTITKYEGLDPESGNTLPPLRILTGGVQLKF